MIKNISILLIILFSSCEDHIEECPCFSEQQNPIYKGCDPGEIYEMNNDCAVMGLYKQIYDELKYPQEAIMDSVEGRVTIAFDVYVDGSIGNYTVVQDTLGHGLASAAIEAIKTLNNKGFCPARENCEPVLYNFILPVLFVLQ